MNTKERIEKIRMIEKMDKNKDYCSQIGLMNTSTFKRKPIIRTTNNIKEPEVLNI